MVLAVTGMVIYSWAVEAEKKAASKVIIPILKDNNASEDMKFLINDKMDQASIKDVEFGVPK